jgi:hypothetical protein
LKRPLNLVLSKSAKFLKRTHKNKVDGSRLMAWALLVEVSWVFADT